MKKIEHNNNQAKKQNYKVIKKSIGHHSSFVSLHHNLSTIKLVRRLLTTVGTEMR